MSGVPTSPAPGTAPAYSAAEILERMSDAYVALDAEGRYVAVNAAAERLLRRPRAVLLGRTMDEVFPSSTRADLGRKIAEVRATGEEAHFAVHFVGDGLDGWFEVDAYPIRDAGRPPYGVAVFWREVTERVRATQALHAANLDLAARNRQLRVRRRSCRTRPRGFRRRSTSRSAPNARRRASSPPRARGSSASRPTARRAT